MTSSHMTFALIDTHAAAAMLGLPPSTLTYWRTVGAGPPFLRIGRRVKYEPDDVTAWARSMRSTLSPLSDTRSALRGVGSDGIY